MDLEEKHIPLERTTLFTGVRFNVEGRTFTGNDKRRDLVIHPGAVVILPVLDPQTYLLIRNWRFAVEKTLWELPAGTLEPDEPPEKTAYRELIEETGYQAGSITPLTSFYSTPGFCNEKIHAYLATDLKHVGQALEDDEEIFVEKVPINRVMELIRSGDLQDAKSIVTILYCQQFYIKGSENV